MQDLNPNVRVSDDAALSLDVRMTSAGLSNVLVGKPYSTAMAAVLHLVMNMTLKHPDVKMRAGVAAILRNTAEKMSPTPEPKVWVVDLDTDAGIDLLAEKWRDNPQPAMRREYLADQERLKRSPAVVVIREGRATFLKSEQE